MSRSQSRDSLFHLEDIGMNAVDTLVGGTRAAFAAQGSRAGGASDLGGTVTSGLFSTGPSNAYCDTTGTAAAPAAVSALRTVASSARTSGLSARKSAALSRLARASKTTTFGILGNEL